MTETGKDPNPRRFTARRRENYLRGGRRNVFVHLEVVGTCNLRCPSCPRGNSAGAEGGRRGPRFLSHSLLRELLTKVRAETPGQRRAVSLYSWGEPLLHQELPVLVGEAREQGFFVSVSTNLSLRRDLRPLLKAAPDSLRVSLSGFFQETYGRTHTGGRVELVRENLRKLRSDMRSLDAGPADVHLAYHWYRHNLDADLREVERLARELGFGVVHKVARLYPLQVLLRGLEQGWNGTEAKLRDLLLVSPEEWRQAVMRVGRDAWGPCLARSHELALDVDGSVQLCALTFGEESKVARSYLDIPATELRERRDGHPLCRRCADQGVFQSHGMDAAESIRSLLAERRQALRAGKGCP